MVYPQSVWCLVKCSLMAQPLLKVVFLVRLVVFAMQFLQLFAMNSLISVFTTRYLVTWWMTSWLSLFWWTRVRVWSPLPLTLGCWMWTLRLRRHSVITRLMLLFGVAVTAIRMVSTPILVFLVMLSRLVQVFMRWWSRVVILSIGMILPWRWLRKVCMLCLQAELISRIEL